MVDHHKRLIAKLPADVVERGESPTHVFLEFKREGKYWIDGVVVQINKGQKAWALKGVFVKPIGPKDYPL